MATVHISNIYQLIDLSVDQKVYDETTSEYIYYSKGSSDDPITIYIDSDLDFNDIDPNSEYAPYIYSWNGFNGTWYATIRGQKHKIKNMSYMGTALWAFLQGATSNIVQNLIIEDMNITTSGIYCGLISSGQVYGCKISGIISSSQAHCIGRASLVRDSAFIGDVTISSTPFYGISGGTNAVMINCFVRANVKTLSTSNPYVYLLGPSCLNCYFVGTYTYGTTPTTNLAATTSTTNFCYVVLKNIAEIQADGFQSTRAIFPTSARSCLYEGTSPWSSASSGGVMMASLKGAAPFKERGYAIRGGDS